MWDYCSDCLPSPSPTKPTLYQHHISRLQMQVLQTTTNITIIWLKAMSTWTSECDEYTVDCQVRHETHTDRLTDRCDSWFHHNTGCRQGICQAVSAAAELDWTTLQSSSAELGTCARIVSNRQAVQTVAASYNISQVTSSHSSNVSNNNW